MFSFLHTWFLQGGWPVAVILIIVGFILLVFGADWLVDGAGGMAKRYGVSNWVIGLTIVAFGTSMPEFVVNMVAAAQHNSQIAITNILGSNSMNIFIILGLTALIYPVTSTRHSRRFDIPWSLLAALTILFLAIYQGPQWLQVENIFNIHIHNFNPADWGQITWGADNHSFISGIGGFILLIGMAIFLWHSFRFAKTGANDDDIQPMRLGKAIAYILIGLIALVIGGELIVNSATDIAHRLGVSDAIIGLTIVALGTSLPELATSCMAAAKKNCDLALGNVIGSNIFNIYFILGTSAVVYPLSAYPGLEIDAIMAALGSILVMAMVIVTRRHVIHRWHGAILLTVYGLYIAYRLIGA